MHIKAALKAAFGFLFSDIELYLFCNDTILKREMEEEISETLPLKNGSESKNKGTFDKAAKIW